MLHTCLQYFLAAFLVWVFVNNATEDFFLSSIIWGVIIVVSILYFLYIRYYRHAVFSLIIGWILGILCSYWTVSEIKENVKKIQSIWYNVHEIEVIVQDVYKETSSSVEYVWRVQKIDDVLFVSSSVNTLVHIPKNFDIQLGDTLTYRSKMYPFKDFGNFSYQKYMLSRDLYFKNYVVVPEKISSENISGIYIWFYDLRSSLLSILDTLYTHEERIFLWGILLGARENIPSDMKEDFNNSGLTHFIAVSGFNITILVVFFGYIFSYFPIWLRSLCIITSIVSFTILVWLSPPVVRAAIMGVIWYIVLVSWRKSDSLTLLLVTAFCMILVSPTSLNYDVSFHLSFLAVLGIVYTQTFFKKCFWFLPEFLAIREAFILTLSALCFTLPIMIFQFGQVSILAPFANIAVTWTIPLAMLLGFLSLLWYMIFPDLGFLIAFFDWILLRYDMMIVGFFGNIEWALVPFDFGVYAPYLQALVFVGCTFGVILYQQLRKE